MKKIPPLCKTCGQELPKKPASKKKPKKFEGTEEDWLKSAAMLAFSYCPAIFHCQHCDYPVVDGYTCSHCGAEDPGHEEDDGESTYYLFSWPKGHR